MKFFVVLPSLNIFHIFPIDDKKRKPPLAILCIHWTFGHCLACQPVKLNYHLLLKRPASTRLKCKTGLDRVILYEIAYIIIVFKCTSRASFLSIEYMICFVYCSALEDFFAESEKWRWKQLWNSFQASLCTKAINESSVDKSYHCMKHNNDQHYSWGAIICHRENNMLTTQVAKPWIAN